MENGKIGGVRTPKLLNWLTQILERVITSISPTCQNSKRLPQWGHPGICMKCYSCVAFRFPFVTPLFARIPRLKHNNDFYAVWFTGYQFQGNCIPRGIKLKRVSTYPIFTPKTPTKRAVNTHFQAKLTQHWNSHTFKTPEPIPTKFFTKIKTNKCSLWVVQTWKIITQCKCGYNVE